jgi:hypothetical protein
MCQINFGDLRFYKTQVYCYKKNSLHIVLYMFCISCFQLRFLLFASELYFLFGYNLLIKTILHHLVDVCEQ